MSRKELYDILLDMPDLFEEDIFSEEEKKEALSKYLFHRHTFSFWKKYYVTRFYGNLILLLEKIARKKKVSTFLEIGCGTASTSIYLANRKYIYLSRGVDIDPIRAKIAKKRIRWHKVDSCEIVAGSVLEMQEDQKFDLVYSMFAYEIIKPQRPLLEKTLSLLSNRGMLVLDMINPHYLTGKQRKEKRKEIQLIDNYFRGKGLKSNREYHSVFTGMDPTGLLKRSSKINNCIRFQYSKS
jgi:ubiquinone/menaquinone biosynthesis C-methylase UbiE